MPPQIISAIPTVGFKNAYILLSDVSHIPFFYGVGI